MRTIKVLAVGVTAAFMALACGSGSASTPTTSPSTATAVMGDSKAANLRVALDNLLGEHIFLAAKATGAALRGGVKDPEFAAYGAKLGTNGTDLGALIGVAYGTDAQNQFNALWSAHNGFFVDYTVGVATKDAAKKAAAVDNLKTKYIAPFAAFLAGPTGLPQNTLADVLTAHVLDTAAVVDDQGAKNYTKVYADLRTAYAQLYKIGDALAGAIASKVPSKFPGDANNSAVQLRISLNELFQEHLFLASMATSAALRYGATDPEFMAAAGALNTNGTDIGAAVGSLYGTDAQSQFNALWSAHNGFFVDYTIGVATKDAAKKSAAVDNLKTKYIVPFAAFLSGATGVPQDALAGLLTTHVLTTAAIVDDQGAKDFAKASTDDRTAAQDMQMIADPLGAAFVAKFPAKFTS
ncbi:MAG: hypothetical protein M3082_08235 [Candidatus Dormibacteraeota bacterium]|nr:hypothetical protein [Candidatus Dormibacteraeota bacterium]